MIEKYLELLNEARSKNDKRRGKWKYELDPHEIPLMFKPDGRFTIITALVFDKCYTERRIQVKDYYKQRDITCHWGRSYAYDYMTAHDWMKCRKAEGFITYQQLWKIWQLEKQDTNVKTLSENAKKSFKKTLVKRKNGKDRG